MVIVALNSGCRLLEADVIEACKGGTTDVFDSVVWNQKLLLRIQKKRRRKNSRGQNYKLMSRERDDGSK